MLTVMQTSGPITNATMAVAGAPRPAPAVAV